MKSNILMVLGTVFALSLLGRVGAIALNAAEAEEPLNQAAMESTALQENAGLPDYSSAADGEAECLTGVMLEEMRETRKQLDEREQAIIEKEATLAAVEKRIEDRMKVLDESNTLLATKIRQLNTIADEDIQHLAAMYENMKPQQASVIFDKMDPSFAAGFLRLMNSDNAGLIMANMNPDRAYAVSVIIANRNAEIRQASN